MYEKPIRIEMTDEEWIASRKSKLIYRPPENNPDLFDEKTILGQKYAKAKRITEDSWGENPNEPKPIKAAKKKPAKIHRKPK